MSAPAQPQPQQQNTTRHHKRNALHVEIDLTDIASGVVPSPVHDDDDDENELNEVHSHDANSSRDISSVASTIKVEDPEALENEAESQDGSSQYATSGGPDSDMSRQMKTRNVFQMMFSGAFGDTGSGGERQLVSRSSSEDLLKTSTKVEKIYTATATCKAHLTIESAENLESVSSGVPEAYVVAVLRGPYAKIPLHTTSAVKSNSPQWNEVKKYKIDLFTAWYIEFKVYDYQGSILIGEVLVPLSAFLDKRSNSFPLVAAIGSPSLMTKKSLLDEEKHEAKNPPRLNISVEISDVQSDEMSKVQQGFVARIQKKSFQYPILKSENKNYHSPYGDGIVCIPGSLERVEVYLPGFVVGQGRKLQIGDLFITNYRIVYFAKRILTQDSAIDETDEKDDVIQVDSEIIEHYSFAVTYSSISEFLSTTASLKEFTSSLQSWSKNYVRSDTVAFQLRTENFRDIRLILTNVYFDNSKTLFKMFKKIVDHKRLPSRFYPTCSQIYGDFSKLYPEVSRSKIAAFSMKDEFLRQQIPPSVFSYCGLNENYQLCPSYPSELYFPSTCNDKLIISSAKFRGKNRLPALTYYSSDYGCCMSRSGQPHTGVIQKNCEEDETLIQSFSKISLRANPEFFIVDARSEIAAGGNKFKGMGFEDVSRYQNAQILFMGIANIHAMRQCIDRIRTIGVTNEIPDSQWFSQLEYSKWFQYLKSIITGAKKLTALMASQGISVLVHCSDGWDRTAQLCALTQMLLDKRFRTFDGLQILIEKDFLSFGHKFEDRLGELTLLDERSPVYIQFLDCVHQLTLQFPEAFEFSQHYLVELADHAKSGLFGTFFYNSEMYRRVMKLDSNSFSIWQYLQILRSIDPKYSNPSYQPNNWDTLIPVASAKRFRFWSEYFLRYDSTAFEAKDNLSAAGDGLSGVNLQELTEDLQRPSDVSESKIQNLQKEKTAYTKCNQCHQEFTLMRRKHTCKICMKSFCISCLSYRLEISSESGSRSRKVCQSCYEYSSQVIQRKASRQGP